MHSYLIREGNGNDGEFKRGLINAENAFEALKKASRCGMINKPKCVLHRNAMGDDHSAFLVDDVHKIYGDCCAWSASAVLVKFNYPHLKKHETFLGNHKGNNLPDHLSKINSLELRKPAYDINGIELIGEDSDYFALIATNQNATNQNAANQYNQIMENELAKIRQGFKK